MKTKCMSCGGSTKKMMTGGTRKKYQDGGPTLEDLEKQTRREFLKGKSAKAGIITALSGIGAGVGKMIADANKKRTAVVADAKKLREADSTMTKKQSMKKSRNTINNKLPEERNGGAARKKYAMGGSTEKTLLPMMGMPMYSSNPRSEQGRILKKGGSTSLPVCKGGLVRMPDGSCGNRKFKPGGTLKPVPTDKVGLAKLPTTVRNKMGFQKKGGAVKKK